MSETPAYIVEFATVDELPFILDAWCAGQADQPHQLVPAEIFKVEMRARVMRLVGANKVAVARVADGSVLGFVCYGWDSASKLPVIHYVYVKGAHRRSGIAKTLAMKAAGLTPGGVWWHTHTTPRSGKIARAHEGIYNSFLLEYLK